ncbi:MAG TPA: type II toxin-antitoxin system PemK/MazF family toxin [Solirubrobacterales bacterium]|nr:type II toxin-antitoxin system PemK/MazF family toxin [Solirubrobacterales bacterium]
MSRGDICWCETVEEGRRPALVLTRAEAIPVMSKVTVAFLTRTIRNIPTEVRLDSGDGMPEECVVALDNVRNISQALLGEHVTSLSGARMHEVCRALAIATGCD